MNKILTHIFIKTVFILVFSFLIFSCSNSAKEKNETQSIVTDTIRSDSNTIASCKPIQLKGKIVAAGNPKIVKAGTPEITAGFNNVHRVGKLKVVENVKE